MARGWESKSVEQQQDDAQSAREPKRQLTRQEQEAAVRRQSLQLSRSRVLQQMQSTENPHYRKTLEQALATLDEQINRLSQAG